MKRLLTIFAFLLLAAGSLLAVAFFAPLPLPFYQDFSVMYFTNLGRLQGIPIYAYPAQLDFVQTLTPAGFTFHPYPYPPWYALATLWLGLLPIQVAARLWFFVNLGLIGGSVWLLTPRWRPIPRLLGVLAAVMFIPAFGLLMVGQYSAPVLFGAALFIWATRQKAPVWAAVSLLLTTFKPHIGGLVFLAGFGWLFYQCRCERAAFWRAWQPPIKREIASQPEEHRQLAHRPDVLSGTTLFARRTLVSLVLGGLFLAAIGFAADAAWPLTYLQSLGRYREIPGVETCGLCASLSVALVSLATGQSSTGTAAWMSLGLLLGLSALLVWRYRAHLQDPAALMALSATLTLLIDPYLLNYDYILLLIPLVWLMRREKLAVLVYFLPWGALALGREGNLLLALAGLVTFFLILRQSIDAPSREAYNPSITK